MVYSTNMNKLENRGFKEDWRNQNRGGVSLEVKKRILQKGEPTIEMKMTDDGVTAEVVLKYFDFISKDHHRDNTYFRIISGNNVDVYSRAVKFINDEYLKDFDKRWNKTLYHLLNKPSKNKSMLNLGTYQPKKDESFGLYNVVSPAQILSAKFRQSNLTGLQLAKAAGIDEGTLYRHLKGTSPISRENAISYAKALGCDPAEILFNPLMVPTWGDADLSEMTSYAKRSVYAGEIVSMDREELVSCPREIYRPDVHAIRLHGGNYNNAVAFYYHSNEKEKPHNGELVIVGIRIKNFGKTEETRLRYFIGIWEIKGSAFNLINMDPDAGDVAGLDPDEDINSFDDIKAVVEANRYVITDFKPEFVAPVVSVINPGLLSNEKKRQEIIKDHLNQITKVRAKEQVDQALTQQQEALLYHQKKVLDNHYKVQKNQKDMEQKIKELERKHKNLQKLYSGYADAVVDTGKDTVLYEFKRNAPKGKLIIQPISQDKDDFEIPELLQKDIKKRFYKERYTGRPIEDVVLSKDETAHIDSVFAKGDTITLFEIDELINKYRGSMYLQEKLKNDPTMKKLFDGGLDMSAMFEEARIEKSKKKRKKIKYYEDKIA